MFIPNADNKRTRARLKTALGMTLGCLDAEQPRPLGTRFIDRYYSQQQNPVSRWLRETLLIEHNSAFRFGDKSECKTYTYNPTGVKLVQRMIDEEIEYNNNSNLSYETQVREHYRKLAVEWVDEAFDIEKIEYNDKSNRLWHPIQNIPKQTRRDYFNRNQLTAQYDIVACAPNLLLQYAWLKNDGVFTLETIFDYTENRAARRKQLAQEAELPEKNIKELINSLFAGAALGANPKFGCWDLCDGDRAKIMYLQQNAWLKALRMDIKDMWNILRGELRTTTITTKTGITRNLVLTSSNKWNLYFRLERQVLNAIREFLDGYQIKHFLLHDAFASTPLSDEILTELIQFVYSETNFFIDLERE